MSTRCRCHRPARSIQPGVHMKARDRRFLQEFRQFSGMNHLVAAVALFRAGVDADATAAKLHEITDKVDTDRALARAIEFRTGVRVQSVLIGRLIAELTAAIEDVAALGWAVRFRRKGLFATYLRSSVGDAASFLDLARATPHPTLERLLRLPPLTEVEENLEPDVYAAIAHAYDLLPRALGQLGHAYRGSGFPVAATGSDAAASDQVHVVLDLLDATSAPDVGSQLGGVLPASYNKLKHRFALIEDIDLFGSLPGEPVLYAHLGRDPATVGALVERIHYVARLGLEIATLIAMLVDAGIDGESSSTSRSKSSARRGRAAD